MQGFGLLSVLIWLPIVAGVVVLVLGERAIVVGRWVALLAAIATFLASIPAYTGFDATTAGLQFVERLPWIPSLNAFYAIGLDGISLPLVLLTTFMTIFVIIAGWVVIEQRPAQYYAAFLIMEGLMVGVFSATDALLFYFFWEAMLIPMFLIIGIWGGPRRVYATIKFFLYTFLGSVLMLTALIYMYVKGHDYSIAALQALPLSLVEQRWIFLAFLLAFAVKVPMWPVHTWLPDAHVEAPTGGSVILAAIMLKMGGYGFLRFSLPITPDASRELALLVIAMSLIAVVYIGFVALVQQDMKKLIAYSSIAHMGFVTLGTFGIYAVVASTGSLDGAVLGVDGAMVQMVSHGLVSGALFLCVGVLYDRMHSREIASYGGVVNVMPYFAALMVFFGMANSGLPGTSGFVGEFMVIIASFKASFWYAFLAATTLILGAAYTLWMVKRVVFGPVANHHVAELTDLNGREFLVLGVLAAAVLLLGLYPAPLLNIMEVSVHHLVQQAMHSKLPL
jgi:NADH-quinone oxidoreductase subunit M